MSTFADGILAALRASVPTGVSVYDTIVPGVPSARYVIAYIPPGMRSVGGVDGVADQVTLQFSTTTVASNPDASYSAAECRWLQGTVQNTLVDLIVTADGHAAAQVVHRGCQNPRPDEATPDKKVYATDQFSLQTVRISPDSI